MSVTLTSSDGKDFIVPLEVANMSKTLKSMMEETHAHDHIPVPAVDAVTLTKVLDWATYRLKNPYHVPADKEDKYNSENIDEWDKKFIDVDNEMLFSLLLAANYLDMKDLLDLGCKTVANKIKGKTADEVEKHFRVPPESKFYVTVTNKV